MFNTPTYSLYLLHALFVPLMLNEMFNWYQRCAYFNSDWITRPVIVAIRAITYSFRWHVKMIVLGLARQARQCSRAHG
jgi:hypothetical protein